PSPAKLSAILKFFHTSLTAHPLKDLEKSLPTTSGISSMQVKDVLQALVDENLIRVEKIGSGNWYWAFAGDERKRRMQVLKALGEEREGLKRVTEQLKDMVEREATRVREENGGGEMGDLAQPIKRVGVLKAKKAKLEEELAGWRDGDPTEVERRRGLVKDTKDAVNAVTDNIYTLLAFVRNMCGNDKDAMQFIWNEYLG
ncbi:meiotic nuclear division protein 1, partial [Kalaharituber pfeilii]